MPGKIIYETESPKTQTVEGVKTLITFHNHGEAPKEMPAFYRLGGEMVLVLSNKKDAYYVVTPRDCSCPSRTYHPGKPCKHQRAYFPQPKAAKEESLLAAVNSRATREAFYEGMRAAGVV